LGYGLGNWGWGWGYPYYGGYYGGYYSTPYYSVSDYYSPGSTYYSSPNYYYQQFTYNAVPQSGYYGNVDNSTVQQQLDPNAADFTVMVPDPNAQIWFENYQTQQRGTLREFESAPLQRGKSYTFQIHARFNKNGHMVDQVRNVPAQAGQHVTVDFNQANPNAEQLPAANRGLSDANQNQQPITPAKTPERK